MSRAPAGLPVIGADGNVTWPTADPPWCCQGAEECDGLRWNAEAGEFEFILYLNDDAPCWHAAVACPLCGARLEAGHGA